MDVSPFHMTRTSFSVLSHSGGYVLKSWDDNSGKPNYDSHEFHLGLGFKFNMRRHRLEDPLRAWLEQQEQRLKEDLLLGESKEGMIGGNPLPLRLPPRLALVSNRKVRDSINHNSFSGLRSKSKEFDPFMAALEKVRKENGESGWRPKALGRRARSFLPMRLVSHLHGCSSGWSPTAWEEAEERMIKS